MDAYIKNKDRIFGFDIKFLTKVVDTLDGEFKSKMMERTYLILKQLFGVGYLPPDRVDLLSRDLIVEIIVNYEFGENIKLLLTKELHLAFKGWNPGIQQILLVKTGYDVMNCEELCKFILKFPCGNTLKVNQIVIPYFECFKYDNFEEGQEQTCLYNYTYLKMIINFFFTGQLGDDCEGIQLFELLLEIDKLGYQDENSNLKEIIFNKVFNLTYFFSDIFPIMFKKYPFEEFISQLDTLCNLAGKRKMTILLNIFTFLDKYEYDSTQLLNMSFFTNHCINNMDNLSDSGKDFVKNIVIKNKHVQFFEKIADKGNFEKLFDIIIQLNGDPFKIFEKVIKTNPEYLNTKKIIKQLPESVITDITIFPKLNGIFKAKLCIKYNNYEYLESLLKSTRDSAFNRNTLLYVANKYKKHDITNGQKWSILASTGFNNTFVFYGTDASISYVGKFMYVHSLNPKINRNIVWFQHVGNVVDLIPNHEDKDKFAFTIKMARKRRINTYDKIFIGDTYNKNSQFKTLEITELDTCIAENHVMKQGHNTQYLYGYGSKSDTVYGIIHVYKSQAINMGMENIKKGTNIFVDLPL
jgi:hypothetical protein